MCIRNHIESWTRINIIKSYTICILASPLPPPGYRMGYRRCFYDVMNSGNAPQGLVAGHGAGMMNRSRRVVGPCGSALARHPSITHNHVRMMTTSLSRHGRTRLWTWITQAQNQNQCWESKCYDHTGKDDSDWDARQVHRDCYAKCSVLVFACLYLEAAYSSSERNLTGYLIL